MMIVTMLNRFAFLFVILFILFINEEPNEYLDVHLFGVEATPILTIEKTDSLTIYYPNFNRIDLVTRTMPDTIGDTDVIFCCAAAFTGECLKEFKHSNVAGDHVASGERFHGYPCKRNTGAFVWYENQWKFLYDNYSHELDSAAKHNGMGFG